MSLSQHELDGLFTLYLLRQHDVDPKLLGETLRSTREQNVPLLVYAEYARLISKDRVRELAPPFQDEMESLNFDRGLICKSWLADIPPERLWEFVEQLITPASLLSLGGLGSRGAAADYVDRTLFAAGGIGEVWKCREKSTGRLVALKKVKPTLTSDEETIRRFFNEGRITARLEHPAIVPVYRVVRGDQSDFYVMRLIEGETLHHSINELHKLRPQSEEWLARIRALVTRLVQVAEAVAFAHSKGVIHRDIKPANIILSNYHSVFLVDWGMAKIHEWGESFSDSIDNESLKDFNLTDDQTAPGVVLGTPRWMSPEQASGRPDEVDGRSDIFALGGVLYAILYNTPPLSLQEGMPTNKLLAAIVRGPKLHDPIQAPGSVRELYAIAVKALERNPEKRYQKAGDFADDLERWLADEPVTAYRHRRSLRLLRWARHHPAISMISAAAAFMLIITAFVFILWLNVQHRRVVTEVLHSRILTGFAIIQERVHHQIEMASQLSEDLGGTNWQESRTQLMQSLRTKLVEYIRYRPFVRTIQIVDPSEPQFLLCVNSPEHPGECVSWDQLNLNQRQTVSGLKPKEQFATLQRGDEGQLTDWSSGNDSTHLVLAFPLTNAPPGRKLIVLVEINATKLFDKLYPGHSDMAKSIFLFTDAKGRSLFGLYGNGTIPDDQTMTAIDAALPADGLMPENEMLQGTLPDLDNRLFWSERIVLPSPNHDSLESFAVMGIAPDNFSNRNIGIVSLRGETLTSQFPLLIPVLSIPFVLLFILLATSWILRPRK